MVGFAIQSPICEVLGARCCKKIDNEVVFSVVLWINKLSLLVFVIAGLERAGGFWEAVVILFIPSAVFIWLVKLPIFPILTFLQN